ncbi:MAG TPA: DNA primase [Sphingomicrobium sp.]|nr:DNA primase [Sphingomicrobium sp.]
MSLSVQFLDELRARTLLSAVIAPSVKLLKAGREYKACCPFHQEKTPSFTVNDEKGFYHCFGCGAHGDAIRFLTDSRGMPFMDAVKELAGRAGMEVPAPDPRARDQAERAAGLTDVMAAAQKWFADQLQGSEGAEARDYLEGRGIDAATAARFGIGLAPQGRTRLRQALGHLGEDKLVETGMLIKPEEGGGESYDRFRGRLMFPIRDQRGRVIAFGGRILGDGEPKYLNSPDTILFDKGRTLYNIDRAAPASRSAKRLVVVEGYMDVIALDRAGISEVVAPNGTAVTESQLERMWRLDPAPILCFDGDSAGRKAAVRAALRALPHIGPDRTLRFVELPPGQDPDDVVRSGGKEAFEALLARPEPLDERLWRHERDSAPLATPEARAGLRQRLIEHSQAIGEPALRRLYRDQWLNRFDSEIAPQRPPRGAPNRPFRPFRPGSRYTPPDPPASDTARAIGAGGIDRATARALIVGFANHPEALAAHCEQLAALPIADPRSARLRDHLVNAAFSSAALDRESLATILENAGAAADLDAARSTGGIGFSFTRSDAEPAKAVRDLGVAIEALSADGEIGAALAEATERLKAGEEQAFEEQRRLHVAREKVKERLASLTGTD